MTDFSRFLEIAYGSLLESVSELMVARKQEFVDVRVYDKLYNEAEQVAKMLSGCVAAFKKNLRLNREPRKLQVRSRNLSTYNSRLSTTF